MTSRHVGALAPLLVLALVLVVPIAQTTPKIRTLTEQEMVDLMVGSSIQASRSSDSAALIRRVREAFAEGRTFTMIDVDDLPDGWTVVMPDAIGGGGAWEYVRERTERQKLPTVADRAGLAVDALSRHIGRKFDAVVRAESASGTLNAFMVASTLGVPVVDACPTGRAVPELSQSITFINGIPAAPAAVTTRWGDVVILDKTVDDYRIEDLGRALAVASGGGVSMAHNAMSAADVRRGLIRGSVSQALLFGRTVREAAARGQDPIDALVHVARGYRLFHGIVTKADGKGERGFTWWDVELQGIGPYAGHVYKVFVKNENIVGWLDGVPDAMSPDIIANLDPRTGDAITGEGLGAYPLHREVVLVAIPASPMWRVPKGIETLGPRHFGFDFDYVPIEQLQEQRKQQFGRTGNPSSRHQPGSAG